MKGEGDVQVSEAIVVLRKLFVRPPEYALSMYS